MKKDKKELAFNDILRDYVCRMKLQQIDGIDDSIFTEWNDHAVVAAEIERQRQHDLFKLEEQRKKEREQLFEDRRAELNRKEAHGGQVYDGRKWNEVSGQYEGWTLKAGDKIRYWGQVNNLSA
eukprot:356970_1